MPSGVFFHPEAWILLPTPLTLRMARTLTTPAWPDLDGISSNGAGGLSHLPL